MWSIGRNKSLMNLTADLHGTVYAVIPFQIFRYEGLTGMPLGEMESTHDDVQENYSDAYAALTGDIYALDRQRGIFKFGPDGRYINRFGSIDETPSPGSGHLFSPNNIAVDG